MPAVSKARPLNEVVANKAARGETCNMSPEELAALEESSQGKDAHCYHGDTTK